MFLARRPSQAVIDRFVRDARTLPLSYQPTGLVRVEAARRDVVEASVTIGRGSGDFERAKAALVEWKPFDLAWVEIFPPHAPLAPGTDVAVLVRHLGFWSLNGCRVLYHVGGGTADRRFGFAYGTLTNHAESGEELFEVLMDPPQPDVRYRIRARSWPQAPLACLGRPIVRSLQRRFRRDSAAAMQQAVRSAR